MFNLLILAFLILIMGPENLKDQSCVFNIPDGDFISKNLCPRDFPVFEKIGELYSRGIEYRKQINPFSIRKNEIEADEDDSSVSVANSAQNVVLSLANNVHLFIECDSLVSSLEKRINPKKNNKENLGKIIDNFLDLAKPG